MSSRSTPRSSSPRKRFAQIGLDSFLSFRKVSRLRREDSINPTATTSTVTTAVTASATTTHGGVVRSGWRRTYATYTPSSPAAEYSAHKFNLDRFVRAQASCFDRVLGELAAGHKRTHWMWYIFPQHCELGRTDTAKYYGIASRDEAHAYLRHPLLGPRLRECVETVLAVRDVSAYQIFGATDELKFRSCLTLFDAVAEPGDDLFKRALDRFYEGKPDEETLRLIGQSK